MGKKGFLDKIIDGVFDMDRSRLYLTFIFMLGFILRLIAAINLGVTADDMVFVNHAIGFLSTDRLIVYHQSSGLWFAFTDLMYSFFGTTQLVSRLAPLIFGSFSIFAIYLLSKEFFSSKVSLISAFLLAIAPFHIKNTFAEMDVMAMFFILISMLFFVRGIKSNRKGHYFFGGIFLGLAIYTKVYPLLFIPSVLLFFAYAKKKEGIKVLSKQNLKLVLIFLLTAFIFTIPAITHNYLLYKDKGFMDLQFSRILIPESEVAAQHYSWDPIWGKTNSWSGLIFGDPYKPSDKTPMLWIALNFIRFGDPINFYLGILGLILIFAYGRKNLNYLVFFFLSILFVLPFLASIILLSKHYLFLEVLLIPAAAFSVKKISDKFLNKKLEILIILLLLFSLILIGLPKGGVTHFYGKSHIAQMIEFKEENIPQNALIVGDSRFYRGRINWVFQGRPYLEGTDFINLLNSQEQMPGQTVSVETYFYECVIDDCGWGTIKDQPEFNASMESLVDVFKANGQVVKEIKEPERDKTYYPLIKGEKTTIVKVYKSQAQIKQQVLELASQPKKWFLYDIGFLPRENQFDYYRVSGIFDTLLDKLARLIVKLSLILTILGPVFITYIAYKSKRIKTKQNLNEEVVSNNSSI